MEGNKENNDNRVTFADTGRRQVEKLATSTDTSKGSKPDNRRVVLKSKVSKETQSPSGKTSNNVDREKKRSESLAKYVINKRERMKQIASQSPLKSNLNI